MYREPATSLSDILFYFFNNGIELTDTAKNNMHRSHLSQSLKSPLYVKANMNIYQYLVSKRYEIIDDVSAFDGIHGCFRHKRKNSFEYIKIGYHEGLVDSETWMVVQEKKSHNSRVPNNGSAKNS